MKLVSLEMIIVLVLIAVMLVSLILEIARPGMIIFTSLVILLITGILTPEDALSGFSNEGMLTIALLFIVAGAIQKSGKINQIAESWLSKRDRKSTRLNSSHVAISYAVFCLKKKKKKKQQNE